MSEKRRHVPEHLRRALRLSINVGIAAATGFALLQPLGGTLLVHLGIQDHSCITLSSVPHQRGRLRFLKPSKCTVRVAFAMGLSDDDGHKVGGNHVSWPGPDCLRSHSFLEFEPISVYPKKGTIQIAVNSLQVGGVQPSGHLQDHRGRLISLSSWLLFLTYRTNLISTAKAILSLR